MCLKAIYLDCFSGISGNMMVGALLDAGLPLDVLSDELKKLDIGSYALVNQEVVKQGVKARYFNVEIRQWFKKSRNLSAIQKLLAASDLSEQVKTTAGKIFLRLAEAEAKVHGVDIEQIHFHEVGAIDSIIDIVGTAIGLEYLGIEQIYASELHVGSGYVKCSHGLMPVPAPATAELLLGIPFYRGQISGELVTPTGAAIVASLAHSFGPIPAHLKTTRIAYGAGSLDLEIPNVLRLYRATSQETAAEAKIVETNIDDLNPQIYSHVMERLYESGAYDVYFSPVIMKKGRPGTKLSVMTGTDRLEQVVAAILKETSTIGVRILDCQGVHLEREIVTVATEWGPVRAKLGHMAGQVVNAAPEFEDCKAIASQQQIPLKIVYLTVLSLLKDWYAPAE